MGVESTIVSFKDPDKPTILRYGGISKEEIEAIIGPVEEDLNKSSNPEAPGQLKKHYSPSTKFVLTDNLDQTLSELASDNCAVLHFDGGGTEDHHYYLSRAGELTEAARNLFGTLRKLDELQYDLIIAEKVPARGLGMAINDRLQRAASS